MQLSLHETKVILNKHEVQGWSEDSGALTLPDAFEFASVRRGATGDMVAFSTGDRGGPVSLSLLPTSPSAVFLMKLVNEIHKNRARVIWEGSVKHTPTGASAQLNRGILMSAPLWYTMGKGEVGNLTFTWEFEEIIPNFDNVKVDGVTAQELTISGQSFI